LVDLRNALAMCEACGPLLVGVAHGDHTAVWVAFDTGDVTVHGNGPGSNNPDADWITHGRILLCELRTLSIA
jgi:hypothetical protein